MTAYQALEHLTREITQLKETGAIMSWDEACMMLESITGSQLDAAFFKQHIHKRYLQP